GGPCAPRARGGAVVTRRGARFRFGARAGTTRQSRGGRLSRGRGLDTAALSRGSTRRLLLDALRRAVTALDVVVEQSREILGDRLAFERRLELAVDEDGRARLLAGAGARDADIRVLALTGAVHHAAHHRDTQLLDAGILRSPVRDAALDVAGDIRGQLLEERARRAAAARARSDLRVEVANAE